VPRLPYQGFKQGKQALRIIKQTRQTLVPYQTNKAKGLPLFELIIGISDIQRDIHLQHCTARLVVGAGKSTRFTGTTKAGPCATREMRAFPVAILE
jgi:hypothetical protein